MAYNNETAKVVVNCRQYSKSPTKSEQLSGFRESLH